MIEDLVHFSVNLRLLKQTGLECEICVYSHPTVSSNLAVWITQYTYCESVWMECTTRPWQAGCGKFTRRLSQMVFTRVSILMHVLTMINLSRCGTACKPTHISSNFFQTPVTAIILVFLSPNGVTKFRYSTERYLLYFANAFVATSSNHLTALSSASWRSINPWSVNFVRGHDSTIWIIVWR